MKTIRDLASFVERRLTVESHRFGCIFGVMAWSFAVLPVAAKYRMTSVQDFIVLETCFMALQFAVVAPLIALAYRLREHKSVSAVSV